MNIHEYQAKALLKQFNVAVPEGHPAFSIPEAVEVAKQLESAGHKVFVVKAQIHAGGRGKAGRHQFHLHYHIVFSLSDD